MKTKVRKKPALLLVVGLIALAAALWLSLFRPAEAYRDKIQRPASADISVRYDRDDGIVRKSPRDEAGKLTFAWPSPRGSVKSGAGSDGTVRVLEKPVKKDWPEISARYGGGVRIAKTYHGEVGKLIAPAYRDAVRGRSGQGC